MEPTTIEVEAGQVGQRLDRFLADRLQISRARVRHLLETGQVRLAGRILDLTGKSRLAALGDRFGIVGSLRAEDESPTPRLDLACEVVSEGSGWLVVNKPAGAGVHPLRQDQDDTVLNAVMARRPAIFGVGEGGLRSGVVHRLDVDTSGVLVFATEEATWLRLRGAFSDHRVDKRYLALVAGRYEKARRLDFSLAITRHQPAHVSVRSDGRSCRLYARPLRIFEAATLVDVKLETGFLHQIRATMAHIGHPVLGDAEYGGVGEEIPVQAPRQMLHAAKLDVDEIRVEIPLPADFEALLRDLTEV
ncbi:MAG: RluA family pseudouridine synthase [bacterium]|nr:RluA family pseudouridine synthase [bacterium]